MKKINFNELPMDVQQKVKDDLYMYAKTYVTFENGKFTSSPHVMLTSTPNASDFVMYEAITRDDVYTKEEQEENRRIFNEETKNMDWSYFGS